MSQRRDYQRVTNVDLKRQLEHHHELLHALIEGIQKMSAELDRISAEVTEMSDAVDSAVTLLGRLADLIRNNAGDPAALKKIADDLDSSGTKLAEAVVANTPADPDPVDPDA